MAERRMFAKTIIDSDAFLEMPISARLLYYDLGMRADDDGFVNSPKKIMKIIGATTDDMNILILRKFIIPFDNGIVVIKHWRLHNYIRKDTYNETNYKEEKLQLELDENKSYRLKKMSVDDQSTQVRLGKVSIDKIILGKKFYGENQKVFFTDEQYEKLKIDFPNDYEDRIQRLDDYMASKGIKYKDCLATIRNWARKEGYKFPSKDTKAEKKVEYVEIDTSNMSNEEYAELLRQEREKQEREELEKTKEIS